MNGPNTGVATQIKEIEPRALYTHCYGHATNLACSDSIAQNSILKNAHDTVQEITKLVKKSPKRDAHLFTSYKDCYAGWIRRKGSTWYQDALASKIDCERESSRKYSEDLLQNHNYRGEIKPFNAPPRSQGQN